MKLTDAMQEYANALHKIAELEQQMMSEGVEYVVNRLDKSTNGKQEFADALCAFYPEASRFQIHARVFKDDMRDTLARYIGDCNDE